MKKEEARLQEAEGKGKLGRGRDVHRSLLHFADTFRDLESDGILDTLNDVDVYCLHYVFLPRLDKPYLPASEETERLHTQLLEKTIRTNGDCILYRT